MQWHSHRRVCCYVSAVSAFGEGKKATVLLHEHADFGVQHGIAVAAHGQDLLDLALADSHGLLLGLQQRVHVKEVAGGLDFFVAELAGAQVGLAVAVLGEVPAWRPRRELDHGTDDNGGNHG